MLWYSMVLLALGLFLDFLSLVLGIRKCARGRGPSGAPVIPLIMYLLALVPAGIPWLTKLMLLVLLTCLHVFCQSIGPGLYSGFLNGRSALHRAVVFGNVARIRRLVGSGADVNARDNAGWTPLFIAASKGAADVVALLLTAGADPRMVSDIGVTPLKAAAAHGLVDIVAMLLDAGADIGVTDKGGGVALHLAVRHGHGDVVTALLAAGADARAETEDGQTPLTIAERYQPQLVPLIREALGCDSESELER